MWEWHVPWQKKRFAWASWKAPDVGGFLHSFLRTGTVKPCYTGTRYTGYLAITDGLRWFFTFPPKFPRYTGL